MTPPGHRDATARTVSHPLSFTLLLTIVLLAATPHARAHAEFLTSDPAPDSQLDVGLTRIVVNLSEDIVLGYSSLAIYDLAGTNWADGPLEHAEGKNTLAIATRPLPDGIYTIEWKALSVDTHVTAGSFLIGVGNATLTTRSGGHTVETSTPGEGAARAIYYVGLMVAIGLPLFFLVVDRAREPPRAALAAAGVLALAGTVGALVNLQALADRVGATLLAIAPTPAGAPLAWRTALLATTGIALLAGLGVARRRALLAVALLGAIGAAVATALGSHSASVSDARAILLASDVLHLLVGGVWVGGVAAFGFAMRGTDPATAAGLVRRFSPLAMASVALLAATGAYASLRFVRSQDYLLYDPYGRLVLVKIALLVVLFGFGAFYQRVVARRLLRPGATTRAFRRMLAAEALVMAGVLVAAGALATTSPPRDPVVVDTTPLVLEFENRTAQTHVILQVSPNPVTVGVQTIRIFLHPLTQDPVPNSTIVQLRVWKEGTAEPETSDTLEPSGWGEWSARAGHFTSVGTWHVKVMYQRVGEGYTRFVFDVPVGAPGAR